jgi:hypothetical protein
MRAYLIAVDQSGTQTLQKDRMWRLIGSFDAIPKDCDLMVAVIDQDGQHALEFPCRRRECSRRIGASGRPIDSMVVGGRTHQRPRTRAAGGHLRVF